MSAFYCIFKQSLLTKFNKNSYFGLKRYQARHTHFLEINLSEVILFVWNAPQSMKRLSLLICKFRCIKCISNSVYSFYTILKWYPLSDFLIMATTWSTLSSVRLSNFCTPLAFHNLNYLFPSPYLATLAKLRQRQWQQNITVTGEEDDSNKVRWAPLEVCVGSDARAEYVVIRNALLLFQLRLDY